MSISEQVSLASYIWRATDGLVWINPNHQGYLAKAKELGLRLFVSRPPIEVPRYQGQKCICYEAGPRRMASIRFSDGSLAYSREEFAF